MADTQSNKGPQDIGGEEAGPVETIDHGMKFWERQANALRSSAQPAPASSGPTSCGARRKISAELRAARILREDDLGAAHAFCIEKGYITDRGAARRKMDEVRARFNVPDEKDAPDQEGRRSDNAGRAQRG